MSHYNSLSDDYYINMNLNTEMELPQTRETVLHYFEQIQKHYPGMRNFYSRDRGEFVLEEDKDRGNYRWATVEPRRICSGYVNPGSADDAFRQHKVALELAPYALTVSPLDCESLNIMFGFDFTYRGNHNQLLVEALGVAPGLEKMTEIPMDKHIVIYCNSGVKTSMVASILLASGYTRVTNILGGAIAWIQRGLPMVQ